MPEMHFRVRWPSGVEAECYSPSYIIEEYLRVGQRYTVTDFVARMREALTIASDRVQARYGFACSSALDQLAVIEETASALSPSEQLEPVSVLEFTKHAARDARAKAKAPEHHTVIVVG